MSAEYGPYVQMCTLAQQMAVQYQKDSNLALAPFLKHFMDEVEVNVAADRFDHLGFMEKIRDPVELGSSFSQPAHPLLCGREKSCLFGSNHIASTRHAE